MSDLFCGARRQVQIPHCPYVDPNDASSVDWPAVMILVKLGSKRTGLRSMLTIQGVRFRKICVK